MMNLLFSLLFGIPVLCSFATAVLKRPVGPSAFLSPGCNSSSVIAAADLALREINAYQREGYVLGLNRIFDVRELQQEGSGSIYYLTLDVLETDCHVLSKKLWSDCNFRQAHEQVFGQCKATFHINVELKFLSLYYYDCVLRTLPAASVVRLCPDCPTHGDPKDPKFLEAAKLTLAKFNAESNHTHYYAVLQVTKATSQWVVGPSYFVEYVIQKTACSKEKPVVNLSECCFLSNETAEMGLCKGSVVNSRIDNQQFVTVHCEIFHHQESDTEEPCHEHGPEAEESKDQHRRKKPHRRRHRLHRPHPESHHHRHHRNRAREEQEQQPPTPETFHIFPDWKKRVGRVQLVPPSNEHVSLHSLPVTQVEQLDGKPVPTDTQEPKSNANPSSTDAPEEEKQDQPHWPLSFASKPIIFPFPTVRSGAESCPGPAKVRIYA